MYLFSIKTYCAVLLFLEFEVKIKGLLKKYSRDPHNNFNELR